MNLAIFVTCVVAALQPSTEIRFREDDKGQIAVVAPLTAVQQKALAGGKLTFDQGEAWLRLCVLDSATGQPGPAMLGSYERAGDELVFVPRTGLAAGRTYRAFLGPADNSTLTRDYEVPLHNNGVPTSVVRIYPTTSVLPANHLKFYIYFSQSMRGGQEIFSQIEILDSAGNALSDVWLTDELWDEAGQMLIIYIHPGRIKWGVLLRDVLGPVLVPGRDYTLVVRGSMLDANGRKLGKDIMKKFHTTAEDRVRVDLSEWKLQAPRVGRLDPVAVVFPKSIDHKSLTSFLTVVNARGEAVPCKIAIGKDEKDGSLLPAQAWQDQEYRLVVNNRLEDVAGNTPQRPFDLDLQAPALPPQRLEVPFRPKR